MQHELIGSNAHFEYPGYQQAPSFCNVDVYRREDEQYVIVATELAANPGTSVTNRCEIIATMIAKHFDIPSDRLIFIEQYNRTSFRDLGELPGQALIKFTWAKGKASHPEWKYVNNIEAILSGAEHV